jgi:integrase
MDPAMQLDAAGRRRSPATLPGYHSGRAPRNKGRRYPADPPRVGQIVAVMRQAGDRPAGLRLRGLIVVLWHADLRISEALALSEGDLERARGAMLVRHGKGGKRREVGMDDWGWHQLDPWLGFRRQLPVGRTLLRNQRTHGWPTLVGRSSTDAVPPHGRPRSSAPSLRPTPAPPCPRCRDGTRGRAPECDPTPARPCGPRDHLGLSTGDREWRDR